MHKIFALALAGAVVVATPALANMTISGTVRSWMPEQRILELEDDGQAYLIPATITDDFAPGMEVELTVNTEAPTNIVLGWQA